MRLLILSLLLALVPGVADVRASTEESKGPLPMPDKLAVLTFDDSVKSHLTVVAPLLKERGFGGTFFVTHAWMPDTENFLDWEEIAELDRMGFEVGNHTWDHIALNLPGQAKKLEEQVLKVEGELEKVGVPKPVSFSWPGNHFGPESRAEWKRLGYRYGRRGNLPDAPAAHPTGIGAPYDPERHDPLLIPTAGLATPGWTVEDFAGICDLAAPGNVLVFQFHGVPDKAHEFCSTPPERFVQFLDHLQEEGFSVINLRDLAQHFDPVERPSDPLVAERVF